MTRFIYDQFSKDYLEILLTDQGKVEAAKQVSDEVREIDLYFIPNSPILPPQLGLIGRLATTPCLFEPYRNPVTLKEIADCLLKLLALSSQLQRVSSRNKQRLSASDLPRLWIITPTASKNTLAEFGAQPQLESGIYQLANYLRTGIIVVHQLPVTSETLWLRLLGRGKVQQQAIDELLRLPTDYPFKSAILEILYTLQKNLEANQADTESEDRELIMRLEPLYQEDKARAIAQGRREGEINLVLRQLTRKWGNLDRQTTTQINQLNLTQLETLAEALLDFNNKQDLETWLRENQESKIN